MSNGEDIKDRLERLKSQSILQKFKPSKHRRAYKIVNNSRKRCYAR